MKTTNDIPEILTAFLSALLWSSGEEFDEYTVRDIYAPDVDRVAKEVINFCFMIGGIIPDDLMTNEQMGHDFALTRNHHGAGFWDRDYPKHLSDMLTETSHSFGEINIYIDGEGAIRLF
jgi:hypothetical protein